MSTGEDYTSKEGGIVSTVTKFAEEVKALREHLEEATFGSRSTWRRSTHKNMRVRNNRRKKAVLKWIKLAEDNPEQAEKDVHQLYREIDDLKVKLAGVIQEKREGDNSISKQSEKHARVVNGSRDAGDEMSARIKRNHALGGPELSDFRKMFRTNLDDKGFVIYPTALTEAQVQQLKALGERLYSSGRGKRINGSNGRVLSSQREMKAADFEIFSTTMETVLQPVKDLLGEGHVHKNLAFLHCAEGCPRQQAHRDFKLEVLNKCLSENPASVLPYSGLLGLEEGTCLWVKVKSHFKGDRGDEYGQEGPDCPLEKVEIPPAHMVVFHGSLVHAGMAHTGEGSAHSRVHVYFNGRHRADAQTPFGSFFVCKGGAGAGRGD